MTVSIAPLSREWIYGLVIQPYKEGAERINRAFAGVDFLTLELRPLSLRERVFSLAAGLLLMTPLINSIVWVAMQTFGQPEFLSDPHLPTASEKAAKKIDRAELAPLPPPAPPAPKTTEFYFTEKCGRLSEKCLWKIEEFPDQTLVTKQSDSELVTARYAKEGEIEEYHFLYTDERAEFHIVKEEKALRVNGRIKNEKSERVHQLKEEIPWVQQMTLGMKRFILSSSQKMEFYIVNPRDLSLHKLIAEKKRTEKLDGFGELLRVDVRSPSLFYSLLGMGAKLWYDEMSGELKKMISHADPREHPIIAEFLQSDPSLEQAHP